MSFDLVGPLHFLVFEHGSRGVEGGCKWAIDCFFCYRF